LLALVGSGTRHRRAIPLTAKRGTVLAGVPRCLDGARIYPGHTGSILDAPAKTIKAGDHGVPGGENMIRFSDGSVRYLTVLEATRLQTFPDNFVIKGVWGEAMRQIGNAVPVLLAETMGHGLMKMLNSRDNLVGIDRISTLGNRQLMLVDI
jgi:site-specific DNA-cytosine methylase